VKKELIFEKLGYGIINGKLLQIDITMFANGGVGKEGNIATNKSDFQGFLAIVSSFSKEKITFGKIS
jgi:hypothetical protein